MFHHQKYSFEVEEISYAEKENMYCYVLKIKKENQIKMKNIPVELEFQLEKTTLLQQFKKKGWFLSLI